MERIIKIFGKKHTEEKDDDFYRDLEQTTRNLEDDPVMDHSLPDVRPKESIIGHDIGSPGSPGHTDGSHGHDEGPMETRLLGAVKELDDRFVHRDTELKEMRSDITEVKDSIRNLLKLYEMVSGMYNPFTDPQKSAVHKPGIAPDSAPKRTHPSGPRETGPSGHGGASLPDRRENPLQERGHSPRGGPAGNLTPSGSEPGGMETSHGSRQVRAEGFHRVGPGGSHPDPEGIRSVASNGAQSLRSEPVRSNHPPGSTPVRSEGSRSPPHNRGDPARSDGSRPNPLNGSRTLQMDHRANGSGGRTVPEIYLGPVPARDTSLFLKLRLIEFSLEDLFFQKIRGGEVTREELRQTDRYLAEFRHELGGTNGV